MTRRTLVALTLSGAAITASLAHTLIDVFIGLFGAGKTMSLAQAGLLLFVSALYGWWAVALAAAATGERGATLALLLLALIWSALFNGLAGLAACAPPCANAFPYQDIAHVGSLVLGGAAAYAIWGTLRTQSGPTSARFTVTAVILLVVVAVFEALSISL